MPRSAVEGAFLLPGEIEYVQVVPACVTRNLLLLINSAPVREFGEVLGATSKARAVGPVPDAPNGKVIQGTLLVAVHGQAGFRSNWMTESNPTAGAYPIPKRNVGTQPASSTGLRLTLSSSGPLPSKPRL